MLLNLIKRLNQRTKYIIGTILNILLIAVVISLVMCLVLGVIGNIAKLSFMISLAGFCFLLFLITAGVLISICIILLITFIIDIVKRDGLKKLLKKHVKTFTLPFFILMVINFIKYKNLEWIEAFQYSLLITLFLIFKTEVDMINKELEKELEKENSLNDYSDEIDKK